MMPSTSIQSWGLPAKASSRAKLREQSVDVSDLVREASEQGCIDITSRSRLTPTPKRDSTDDAEVPSLLLEKGLNFRCSSQHILHFRAF
jgi:hypothetical protein